ncbi:MAG: hypothetical protein KDB80_01350 [Planctomycetes bacterium]|nr:hypothetical protein [Planctomycetota bacterium]
MKSYRHTQVGTVILVTIAVVGITMVALSFLARPHEPAVTTIAIVTAAALLLVAGMFSTLTVEVDERRVEIRFGPGWIRRRIPLGDIARVEAVRNSWWYGWGIRLTPSGWLWNVSGLDAVELELRTGRRFRIGTDEPERLADVLRDRLS